MSRLFRQPSLKARGFTLVELSIALVIFALLAGSGIVLLSAKINTQRQRNSGFVLNTDDGELSQTINDKTNLDGTAQPPRMPFRDIFNPDTRERESLFRGGKIVVSSRLCRQSGAVLLGLMIVLILASGYFVISKANRFSNQQEREAANVTTLLQARDGLLARAVTDANRPGSLPCPAPTSDGYALPPPCATYVGWLPWRTLDLPDPRDSSGERLWYVLSPPFQDSGVINSTTIPTLTLDGSNGVAALIIAPGAALTGQNRPSNNMADYFDDKDGNPITSNRDGDQNYFSGPASNNFNDVVLALDTTTLFSAVAKRVLGEIRYAYAAGSVAAPDADNNNDGLPDIGINIGGFPYRYPPYAISSPSTPSLIWYDSLKNNNWFPWITYNRITKTVILNGQTVTLQ